MFWKCWTLIWRRKFTHWFCYKHTWDGIESMSWGNILNGFYKTGLINQIKSRYPILLKILGTCCSTFPLGALHFSAWMISCDISIEFITFNVFICAGLSSAILAQKTFHLPYLYCVFLLFSGLQCLQKQTVIFSIYLKLKLVSEFPSMLQVCYKIVPWLPMFPWSILFYLVLFCHMGTHTYNFE